VRILGIDPGLTIGIALIETVTLSGHPEMIESGQIMFDAAPPKLQKLVRAADYVAIERYNTGTGRGEDATTRQHEAVWTVGGVIFFCRLHGVKYRLQTSSDAKNVFSNPVIESVMPGVRVVGPHARDALRHALLAARTSQKKL